MKVILKLGHPISNLQDFFKLKKCNKTFLLPEKTTIKIVTYGCFSSLAKKMHFSNCCLYLDHYISSDLYLWEQTSLSHPKLDECWTHNWLGILRY